ncbi:MAG: hypothetical protein K2P23_10240 [Lachnospiraceae bacterium]|nr:hypothetical protein [Lachnospiraceae bacterium]
MTRELLEVITKIKIPKRAAAEKKKGGGSMLKAFEDYKLEGKIEGRREYLVQQVCKKLQKNKPANVIAEELEEELQEIEKILAAQQKVQNYDVEQICAELVAAHDKIL